MSRIIIAASMIVLLWHPSALAWSRSCDPTGGPCLWWAEREVVYYINEDCSGDVPVDDCIAAVRAAFDVWNDAECSDFKWVYGGTTPRRDTDFVMGSPDNINLVVWTEDEWSSGDRSAIAMRTSHASP